MLDRQQTIIKSASIEGIGLHSGVTVRLRVNPAPADTGIVFRRTDLEGFEIKASARNVARVSYATSLMRKGVLISTTEHLLSALAASAIDNAYIEIDNLEVPILDGSALPFFRLLGKAGIRRQRSSRVYAKLLKPVEVIEGSKRIFALPADDCRLTYHIAFPHPLIREQEMTFEPGQGRYEVEIAPARTFGFIEEAEMLRKSGLVRGGSLENAIVLTRDGLLNPEGLRFPDEFCRHKILDLIGDLALLGHSLVGHVIAERAGHAMHVALVNKLLRVKGAFELVRASELQIARKSPQAAPVEAPSPA